MKNYINPFEYEAANKLSSEQILDFYIEDFNYTRFINSRRNVYLIGERGTGKSMTLLYNSLNVQYDKALRNITEFKFDTLCIYVPCNTTLIHKREYELIEKFDASVVCEHFLVLSIMFSICKALYGIPNLIDKTESETIKNIIEFALDLHLPRADNLFDALMQSIQKQLSLTQNQLNSKNNDIYYSNTITFSSGVLPLITSLRKIEKLKNAHFAIMIDDAHDLNKYQISALNSWIAYRDNTMFSFKVATAKVNRPTLITSSGGTILEGHDFILIDMEQPFQNQNSDYGKLAKEIFSLRLKKIGINKTPEEFFPINDGFASDLEKCKLEIEEKAKLRYPEGTEKQVADFVYKYARAEYFRNRSPKANRPPYSGFEILVHISTGVIRNLLEPCYWMFDRMISESDSNLLLNNIKCIPSNIQTDIILDRSRRKWDWIREGLDKSIDGCTREQGKYVYQLFEHLAILFHKRLLSHQSEPRAITFSISEKDSKAYDQLEQLLNIARKAQILYTYSSSAKDLGMREVYYVPNRILWPDRGLDPCGQHARVSIKASSLWNAAISNIEIPYDDGEGGSEIVVQECLNV